MIIATLPALHHELAANIARHRMIDGSRYNIGMKSPISGDPEKVICELRDISGGKPFWLDLKGRQLRIERWADPNYGEIMLNHEIDVDIPATVFFRGSEWSSVVAAIGNIVYVSPDPPEALGAGQAVNIRGSGLSIKGYLTQEDRLYLSVARGMNIMASFIERESDIQEILDIDPEAKICLKIESLPGIEFVRNVYPRLEKKYRLIAARDDLMINLEDKTELFDHLALILDRDPDAIVASRLLLSLDKRGWHPSDLAETVSVGDLSDLHLMRIMGFRNFMLSDSLCRNGGGFDAAMMIMEDYFNRYPC